MFWVNKIIFDYQLQRYEKANKPPKKLAKNANFCYLEGAQDKVGNLARTIEEQGPSKSENQGIVWAV